MVTYDFYKSTYCGCSVSPEEWPTLVKQAQSQLDKYKRQYTVVAPEKDSEAMAVCAMVDSLAYFIAAQNGNVGPVSASVGSISVSYSNAVSSVDISPKAQEKELYRCCSQHLEICRGVC